MTAIEHAYAVAQELTPEERIQLANMLLEEASDDPHGWYTDALEVELDKITAAIDSGQMKTYSLEEVRERVSDRLDGKRDSLL